MGEGTEGFPPLSSRERGCLLHLARGMTVEEIAGALSISDKTVEKYITSARKKLGASTREQAVAIAIKTGIL